jgi:hypothetical protein
MYEWGQVMRKYRVTINLNSISYELDAENEQKATEYAQECFYDEKAYDLIKWATYEIETYDERTINDIKRESEEGAVNL